MINATVKMEMCNKIISSASDDVIDLWRTDEEKEIDKHARFNFANNEYGPDSLYAALSPGECHVIERQEKIDTCRNQVRMSVRLAGNRPKQAPPSYAYCWVFRESTIQHFDPPPPVAPTSAPNPAPTVPSPTVPAPTVSVPTVSVPTVSVPTAPISISSITNTPSLAPSYGTTPSPTPKGKGGKGYPTNPNPTPSLTTPSPTIKGKGGKGLIESLTTPSPTIKGKGGKGLIDSLTTPSPTIKGKGGKGLIDSLTTPSPAPKGKGGKGLTKSPKAPPTKAPKVTKAPKEGGKAEKGTTDPKSTTLVASQAEFAEKNSSGYRHTMIVSTVVLSMLGGWLFLW
jgi:hypothetical protein